MKKIAIYTQDMNNETIFAALNRCKVDSVSLFFEKVGNKPTDHDFGIFSSTEILNYNGPLIVDFLEGVKFAINCCNAKSSFFYLYNKEDKDLMGLMSICLSEKVIICCLPDDVGEVIRKIGDKKPLVVRDLDNLVEIVMKHE